MTTYNYTELYYGTPCQVRFYDKDTRSMDGGIALNDFVICGRNGEMRTIASIIEDAASAGIWWDDAIIELDWIDISTAIL